MLKGKLVNLRAVEKKDLEEIMKWVNDREVTKYLSAFLYPVSWAEEEKFLERAMSHNDTEKNLVMETKEGDYVGQISLHKIDWKNRNAELGIVIGNKEYWGKGYGTDAIKILLNHAFNQMNLYKVYLRVFDYN
ncbi:GNAT family N-acetyltransferase, partial [bacterium]|nr:GNAT family N-acetyltransferase [bacterium]